MTSHADVDVSERAAIARAAREHGVDVEPEVLLAIVLSAFASHESMTTHEQRFLLESGVSEDAFDPRRQALARAQLAGRVDRRTHASAWLSTAQVAERLGRAPSNIRRSAGTGDLYAISDGPQRELTYPAWQFVGARPLRGLRVIMAALPTSIHPLSLEAWMTTSREELDGRTPVQWLSTGGDIALVTWLAESYARL